MAVPPSAVPRVRDFRNSGPPTPAADSRSDTSSPYGRNRIPASLPYARPSGGTFPAVDTRDMTRTSDVLLPHLPRLELQTVAARTRAGLPRDSTSRPQPGQTR